MIATVKAFLTASMLVCFTQHVLAGPEKPNVIWRITNWEPYYILNGPLAGQGVYDKMIAEFQKALPGFSHTRVVMTTQRALQQMKDGRKDVAVCHVSMLQSSITGFAYVSHINSILLPHVIFAWSNVAPKIRSKFGDEEGYVSIEQLMLSGEFRGAHSSLGTHEVLSKYQYVPDPLPNVSITAEDYGMLGRLFVNRRVDYIVQYEPFRDTLIQAGAAEDGFEVIKIKETKGLYVPVYAGCTRNAVGMQVIAAINRVLERNPKVLRDARMQGLTDAQKEALVHIFEKEAPQLLVGE